MSTKKKLNGGMPTSAGTVFVVDDDAQVLKSIEQLASSVGLTVKSFASADQFLEVCDPSEPGCLVTDVRMPGTSGLELQQLLHANAISLPVIVMTGYAEVPMAVQAFHEGAFDFVQKPISPQALLDIIQRAIDTDAGQRQRDEDLRETAVRLESLSPREAEVMWLLVDGRSTKEIATALDISLTTVDFHRNNVLGKMCVDNVVELTQVITRYELSRRAVD